MKSKKVWIGVGIIAVIAIIAWLLSGDKKEEKVEFQTAKVEKTNIRTSITATGTIEPVTSAAHRCAWHSARTREWQTC